MEGKRVDKVRIHFIANPDPHNYPAQQPVTNNNRIHLQHVRTFDGHLHPSEQQPPPHHHLPATHQNLNLLPYLHHPLRRHRAARDSGDIVWGFFRVVGVSCVYILLAH